MLLQSPNFRTSAISHDKNKKKKWGSTSTSKSNIHDYNNIGYQKLQNIDTATASNNSSNSNNNNNNNNSLHNNENYNNNESEEISHYEISIMTGILKLSKVSVSEIMINIKDMYMLSDSIKLDDNILHAILRSGYSRIPIFKRKDKQHIKGYLLVKSLVVINPNDKIAIESLDLREPLVVRPSLGLLEMLNMFREGECHLALVSMDPMKALKSLKDGDRPMDSAAIVGMVTLEDVIEKMIQNEIIDETDAKPNKYPHNACSSTLLYHNVGGKATKSFESIKNITKNIELPNIDRLNEGNFENNNKGIVRVHSSNNILNEDAINENTNNWSYLLGVLGSTTTKNTTINNSSNNDNNYTNNYYQMNT